VRKIGDATRDRDAARRLEENRAVAEYLPGDKVDIRDDTFMPRFS